MPFKEYEEFAHPLQLPIRGKLYTIPPIGIQDGLKLTTALDDDAPTTNDELVRLLLGTAHDELVADNVPSPAYSAVLATAWAEFKYGRAAAERVWERANDPKATAPTTQSEPAETTPEAAASTTPRRASGSGTRTKRPTSRSPKSSSTGA